MRQLLPAGEERKVPNKWQIASHFRMRKWEATFVTSPLRGSTYRLGSNANCRLEN